MNRTTFLLMIAGFGAFGLGAWLAAAGGREMGIAMMAVGLLFQVLTLRQLKTARKGQTTQKGSGDAG